MMRSNMLVASLLASALFVPAAFAQTSSPSSPPASSTPPAATAPAPAPAATVTTAPADQVVMTGQWRASKLIGLNVYNDQNEKLGDINEVLVDKSGKVTGVVIGVGGFLGIGEKLILVTMDKLKFVDEPMRTTSTAPAAPAGTTGAANPPARTTGSGQPASTSVRSDAKWHPDHAVLSGVTKDQLKSMPDFKFS